MLHVAKWVLTEIQKQAWGSQVECYVMTPQFDLETSELKSELFFFFTSAKPREETAKHKGSKGQESYVLFPESDVHAIFFGLINMHTGSLCLSK